MARPSPPILSPGWHAWSGLVLGPAAWLAHHQLGSNLNFARCDVVGGPAVVAIGMACLALALVGGWLSWRAWRRTGANLGDSGEPAGRFIALLSLLAVALFALTIVVQTGAGLIIPDCWR